MSRDPRTVAVLMILLAASSIPLGAKGRASTAEKPATAPEGTSTAETDPTVRALEIEARSAALRVLEADLEAKLGELTRLREEMATDFLGEPEDEGAELATLVAFYQAMKPKNAATLLERLPNDLAANLLSAMKTREAGKILNSMDPDVAVRISARMAKENP